MEATPTATDLIRFLASTHRVVVLGGLAVISHGLSRVTHDADCWLEPNLSTELWCEAVKKILIEWPRLRMVSIGDWSELPADELAGYIEDFGVVRILGATQPFDEMRAAYFFLAVAQRSRAARRVSVPPSAGRSTLP